MILISYRLTGIIDKEGKVHFDFSKDKDDSHRKMCSRLTNDNGIDRDFDIPIYGRFYVAIFGNSRRGQLIIYGESSDYQLSELGHYADQYENDLRDQMHKLKRDILFLP